MKKLIGILAVVLLMSCTTTKFASKQVYMLDFRPYTEKGFLMSTTNVGVSYTGLAEINVVCKSGYVYAENKSFNDTWQDVYSDSKAMTVNKNTARKYWTTDEVLEQLYNEAKAVGANGLINIRITSNQWGSFTDYELSGMAIKIVK
jgi:hypothetical protein